MTQEQIEYLDKIMELDHISNIVSMILYAALIIGCAIIVFYYFKKFKKVKEFHEEYKKTLNDEQIKAIKDNNKYKF